MSKLSYEDKINLYNDKKSGLSIKSLCSKYRVCNIVVEYLTRLIDKHGIDISRTTKNKDYSIDFKMKAIERVLTNSESMTSIVIELGLSSKAILLKWIKNYKENSYNIVERKRGRPTMPKKSTKSKMNETMEEKVKRLEEENLYLKAELEYSKKLRAVVQARKNQQQKKK